jgi:hypothetical protein
MEDRAPAPEERGLERSQIDDEPRRDGPVPSEAPARNPARVTAEQRHTHANPETSSRVGSATEDEDDVRRPFGRLLLEDR